MKKVLKVICIILAIIIVAGGCGKTKPKPSVKGGYRETEITMPEGYQQYSNPIFLADGRLMMLASRMTANGEPVDNGGGPIIYRDYGVKVQATVRKEEDSEDLSENDEELAADIDSSGLSSAATTDVGPLPIDPDKPVDPNYPDEPYEEVIYETHYEILVWNELSGSPTVDPVKLPENTYFDSNNSLMTDFEGKPVLRTTGYKEETGEQLLRLFWLPEAINAGRDAEAVEPVKSIEIAMADIYPNAVIILPNGQVACASWDRIVLFGQDGKKVKESSTGYIYQMTKYGSNIVAVDGEKGELVYYDAAALQEQKRVKITRTVLNNTNNMIALEDGSLYFSGMNGVYLLEPETAADSDAAAAASKEGETREPRLVLDAMGYSLADPNISISGFAVSKDKSLFILGNSNYYYPMYRDSIMPGYGQQPARGFIYKWDPELDLSNKTILTVSSLWTDQMLRVAAFEFQKKHPDVQIKLTQYYDKMENEMPWSDFIRAINTDILSGKAADVMFLDNLPLKSYSRRGVLVDLSDYIDDFGGADKLNMGIVNGMRDENGKLYALPLMFSTYQLIGRKNVIDQVTDLKSILTLNLAPDQKALAPQEREQLFQQLLQTNMPCFIDEKTGNYKFDSPVFIEFLELFDRLYYEAQTPPPPMPEYDEQGNVKPGPATDTEYWDFWNTIQKDKYLGKVAMSMQQYSYLDGMQWEFTLMGGKDASWTFLPQIKDMGGAVFTPSSMLGISANSKNKELAAEFIKMIFSGEIENMRNYIYGFSTIKAYQEEAIQNILKQYKEQDENGWGPGQVWIDENLQVDMIRFTETQLRDTIKRLEECTVPIQYDQTLSEFMNEELRPFLKGEKSAREAAESLQRRAAAYLGE